MSAFMLAVIALLIPVMAIAFWIAKWRFTQILRLGQAAESWDIYTYPLTWLAALLFSAAWLPVWYSYLATLSQPPSFNPEIDLLHEWLTSWLLTAFILHTSFTAALFFLLPKQPSRAAHIFIITVCNVLTILSSYWLMPVFYNLLYIAWWPAVLIDSGAANTATLHGLEHTKYSISSFLTYFRASLFLTLFGGIWCRLTLTSQSTHKAT